MNTFQSFRKKFEAICSQCGIPYVFNETFLSNYFKDPSYIHSQQCFDLCHLDAVQIINDIYWIYSTLVLVIKNNDIPELLQHTDRNGIYAWADLYHNYGFEQDNQRS